jgi:hypothetical protein
MCVSESVVVHLCLSNTCNMFNVIDDTLLYAMSIFIFSIIILFIELLFLSSHMHVVCSQESSFHLVVDVNFPLYVSGVKWLNSSFIYIFFSIHLVWEGHCGRDRMVVGFTTTYAISAYHHWCCEFESRSGRGVQHYVIKFVSDLWQVGGFI